ncbi:MAG: hypothetical protein EGR34_09485 [Prevotella sp.]|nr:hypothetical protein [Prevotella sp.]
MSWCTAVGFRSHNTCCASAYQLLCKRTTAVVRLKTLTSPTTGIHLSGNYSYMFRQLPLLFTIDYYAC